MKVSKTLRFRIKLTSIEGGIGGAIPTLFPPALHPSVQPKADLGHRGAPVACRVYNTFSLIVSESWAAMCRGVWPSWFLQSKLSTLI